MLCFGLILSIIKQIQFVAPNTIHLVHLDNIINQFKVIKIMQTNNLYIHINNVPKYTFQNHSQPSRCFVDRKNNYLEESQENTIEFKQEIVQNAEENPYSVTINGKANHSALKGSQIIEKVVNPNSKKQINNFLVQDFQKAKPSPPKFKKSQTLAYLPYRPLRRVNKGSHKEVNMTMKRKLQQKMHKAQQKLAQLAEWYNFRKNQKKGILQGTIDATQSLNYLLSIGASPF